MVTGESFNDVIMLYRNGSKTESCKIIGSLHTRDEALTDCIASKEMANTCIVCSLMYCECSIHIRKKSDAISFKDLTVEVKYIYTQGTRHDFAPNTVYCMYTLYHLFKTNIHLGLHTSKLALVIDVSPSDDIVNNSTYSIRTELHGTIANELGSLGECIRICMANVCIHHQ